MVKFYNYLNFYLKSETYRGVHSPFVFKLIKFCFYDKSWKKEKKFIFLKKNKKSNTIFFVKKLKIYLSNNCLNNASDNFIFKIASKNKHVEMLDALNIEHTQFILFIDNGSSLRNLIRQIINKNTYVIIDFYFWIIILKKTGNQPQVFRIRIL